MQHRITQKINEIVTLYVLKYVGSGIKIDNTFENSYWKLLAEILV